MVHACLRLLKRNEPEFDRLMAAAEEPQEQPATPAGPSQTQQATAAATAAISDVRAKLVAGEQFLLSASIFIVVVSYFIFDFLLENPVVGDFSVT